MVDVQDVEAVLPEEVDRHAVDVAAVEEHDRALRDVVGSGPDEALEVEAAVLPRQRELVRRHVHHRVLAELLEDQVGREQGTQRVAVRVLVGSQEKLVGFPQLRQHLIVGGCGDRIHGSLSLS